MQPSLWVGLLLSTILVSTANAPAEIREWGGETGGYGYTINQDQQRILITMPGTYKFESITNGEPDDINLIETLLDFGQGNGPFEAIVHIGRDPNFGTGPGCRDLGGILPGNGLPVSLGECSISGGIATLTVAEIQSAYGNVLIEGSAPNLVRFSGDILAPLTLGSSGISGVR